MNQNFDMPMPVDTKLIEACSKIHFNWPAVALMAVLLAIPRILLFKLEPGAILSWDSTVRYLPSLLAVSEYWQNYFTVTGPLYVAWLQLIKACAGNEYQFWVVVLQHILGWLAGITSFFILAQIKFQNRTHRGFWFLIVLLVFTSPHLVYYEHDIIRESLAVFLTAPALSLLLFLSSLRVDDSRVSRWLLMATWLLLLGSLVRQEIIFLWLVVVGIAGKIIWNTGKQQILWLMFVPALLLFATFRLGVLLQDADKVFQKAPYSGAKFNISYHYLRPENFDYNSPKYPYLVNRFHSIAKEAGGVSAAMGEMYKETNTFIAKENMSSDFLAVMDEIFLDQVRFNTTEFIISYLKNLDLMVLGNVELPNSPELDKVFGDGLTQSMSHAALTFYSWPNRNELNKLNYLFFGCVAGLIVFFGRRLPLFIVIAFWSCLAYLSLVSLTANSVARFRLSVELPYYIATWGGLYFFIFSRRFSNRAAESSVAISPKNMLVEDSGNGKLSHDCKLQSERRNLSIVIPAYNEGMLVEETLAEVLLAATDLDDFEVIFVNDGSSDDTAACMDALAEKHPKVRVIHHEVNLGLGAAYNTGVHAAMQPFVILVPGDNCFAAESLRFLFSHVGSADIIIPFHLNADVARPFFRRFISTSYTMLANLLSGKTIPYYNGIVIQRTEFIKEIGVRTDGFAYQLDLLVRMLRRGASYATVGIYVNERAAGKTKAFRLRNVVQVVSVFINIALRRE